MVTKSLMRRKTTMKMALSTKRTLMTMAMVSLTTLRTTMVTQPEDDVYFIFYEDKPEEEQLLKGYVSDVAPPAQESKFSPPKPESVRTVYVPYENAVNVPGVFDVSVGSSFGYSEPTARPVASNPSYDNPISSFDAPIYDENSYTAEASSYDANTFSEPLWRGNAGSLVRKVSLFHILKKNCKDFGFLIL